MAVWFWPLCDLWEVQRTCRWPLLLAISYVAIATRCIVAMILNPPRTYGRRPRNDSAIHPSRSRQRSRWEWCICVTDSGGFYTNQCLACTSLQAAKALFGKRSLSVNTPAQPGYPLYAATHNTTERTALKALHKPDVLEQQLHAVTSQSMEPFLQYRPSSQMDDNRSYKPPDREPKAEQLFRGHMNSPEYHSEAICSTEVHSANMRCDVLWAYMVNFFRSCATPNEFLKVQYDASVLCLFSDSWRQ